MRIGHRRIQAAAFIALVVSTSGGARAEGATLGELSFELPAGWAPAVAPGEAPRGGLLCSWERRDGGRMTLCVEARPRPTRWSLENLRREMPAIERSVRGAAG